MSVLKKGKLWSSNKLRSFMRQVAAGSMAATLTCASLIGCAPVHTDEDFATAMRWHKAGVFTGAGLALGGISYAAIEKERFKPLSSAPTVMVITGIGLAVGTAVWTLVVTRNLDWATVATRDADTDTWLADRTTVENADALALRNYLRANLTPKQYHRLPAVLADRGDAFLVFERPDTQEATTQLYYAHTADSDGRHVLVNTLLDANGVQSTMPASEQFFIALPTPH